MAVASPTSFRSTADVVERTFHVARTVIRELDTPASAHRAAQLFREVWRGGEAPAPANLLRTVQHSGGYVFGAYDEAGVMLAASIGLLAAEGLHSHITGVLPLGRRRGLGLALKRHQRAWALERGLTTIGWTCDPLVRRNMAFNLHALGARVVGYLVDHYGQMEDGVNKGDESDRFQVRWDLLSSSTLAAESARLPWVDSVAPCAVREGPDGVPVLDRAGSGSRCVQLPSDIEALRRADPSLGRAWRLAVRDAVVAGISVGATITGLTAEGALVMEVSSRASG